MEKDRKQRILENFSKEIAIFKKNKIPRIKYDPKLDNFRIKYLEKAFEYLSTIPSDDELWGYDLVKLAKRNGIKLDSNTIIEEGDWYWFEFVLYIFEKKLRKEPDNQEYRWILIAVELALCLNSFGREHLIYLVEQDIKNIKWLISCMMMIISESGANVIVYNLLNEALVTLKNRINNFEEKLQELAKIGDQYMEKAIELAFIFLKWKPITDWRINFPTC